MHFVKANNLLMLATALLLSDFSNAQTQSLGSWNMVQIRYMHSERWNAFAEAQLRSLLFYDHFHYYEYKGGLEYKATKDFRASLGMGRYETYREGGDFVLPKNNSELRLWPQLIFTNQLWGCTVEHRYRVEMRFSDTGYRTRLRYRLGLQVPFAINDHLKQKCQLGVSTEVFFGTFEPYFQRNRIHILSQYKLQPHIALQLGYIYQFDYQILDEIGRDFLQLGCLIQFTRKNISKWVEKSGIIDE